jgi:hypothetical protein
LVVGCRTMSVALRRGIRNVTGLNAMLPSHSEDQLVQQTFADYRRDTHDWDSLFAWNDATFGPHGTLGRGSEREVVSGWKA